jgi:hypothetical protein
LKGTSLPKVGETIDMVMHILEEIPLETSNHRRTRDKVRFRKLVKATSKMEVAKAIRNQILLDSCKENTQMEKMCYVSSMCLLDAFRWKGWDAYLAGNAEHCWVISNGEVWDLTATQFNVPVKIVRTKQRKDYPFYNYAVGDAEWIDLAITFLLNKYGHSYSPLIMGSLYQYVYPEDCDKMFDYGKRYHSDYYFLRRE